MDVLTIVLGLLFVWVIVAFALRMRVRSPEAPSLPGVRREAARTRYVPKGDTKVMTREVMSQGKRFFLDVHKGSKGTYLKISELERREKNEEKGFTVIVHEDEIVGFYKALRDSVRGMGKEIE